MKAELAAIFKKIGDKSLSREGMEDLYRFQQEHPAVSEMMDYRVFSSLIYS